MSFLFSLVRPLAYVSLPVLLLRSVATSSPVGRYYVRMGVYVGTLTTVAACSAIIAAAMAACGRRFDVNYVVARTFYALAGSALDLTIDVEGEENLDKRPAVLMVNHQSMLDVLVVGRLMPPQTSIMSKESLKYTPLGPFMSMSGAIFVNRGRPAEAIKSLEAAGALMKAMKISLWMFPEGTRYSAEQPDMLPLKKGGFHLAIEAGIPIIPIVTENYWRIYHKNVFDTGRFKVRVLPPIPTAGLTTADIPELAVRVRDQMLNALREISVVPSGQQHPVAQTSPPQSPVISTPSGVPTSPHVADIIADLGRGSNISIASSSTSSQWRSEPSENGAETEEDEGMILVGRPGS